MSDEQKQVPQPGTPSQAEGEENPGSTAGEKTTPSQAEGEDTQEQNSPQKQS